MAREGILEVEDTAVEALPTGMFRVELPNGHRIMPHTCGPQRQNYVEAGIY